LGLEFLQADDIRILLLQPVQKAFAGGGSNTVKVCSDDSEHGSVVGCVSGFSLVLQVGWLYRDRAPGNSVWATGRAVSLQA
jgi:hypothetical protein